MGLRTPSTSLPVKAKLCGTIDVPGGWDAIRRDLDMLEKWAQENLMRFNRFECKVLNMDYYNLHY